MKIAVVGVGGVGGYFGGKLAKAGVDTVFIARGAMLEALRSKGLRVESFSGDFTIDQVNATDDPATTGAVDAVIFATKAWQIPEAAERAKPLIGKDTIAVPLENGMEAPEQQDRDDQGHDEAGTSGRVDVADRQGEAAGPTLERRIMREG